MKVWVPYPYRLGRFSDLPIILEVCPSPGQLPSDPADVEFFVPPVLSTGPVLQMIAEMPSLKVIQLLSAGADAWIGMVPEGAALCDGRGIYNSSTAEWALTAILAHLRTFPAFIRAQSAGRWLGRDEIGLAPELTGRTVLVIGAGAIGEGLAARLIACEATVVKMARSPREGVYGIDELPALLPIADVVVLLVPLTAATVGMVDAAFLGLMHDGALLVNAARGPVVVTDALVAEVRGGRLAAALDVTDPEPLPDGHPLWSMPNVIITPHVGGAAAGVRERAYALIDSQLRRHLAGEPLANVVTGDY